MLKAIMTAVAGVTLAACASAPVAPERVQASEQAIQVAQSAGAERQPDAAKYLALARGEMTQSKKLSESDPRQAETMLARAEWDAKLATVKAKEGASKADVQRLADELKKVSANE